MIELLMKYCCSFLLLLLFGISGGFAQDKVECWGRYEISLPAKVKGNPFDIELTATFSGPDTTLTVRGFIYCIYNWLLLNSLQVISRKYGRSL